MKIKALSIVAPNGSKIASGEKIIEVRSWKPDLRPDEDLLIVENSIYLRNPEDSDPNGKGVAIIRVKNVREFLRADIPDACASRWEPGYYSWELDLRRRVSSAINVPATRGIYEVEFDPD